MTWYVVNGDAKKPFKYDFEGNTRTIAPSGERAVSEHEAHVVKANYFRRVKVEDRRDD